MMEQASGSNYESNIVLVVIFYLHLFQNSSFLVSFWEANNHHHISQLDPGRNIIKMWNWITLTAFLLLPLPARSCYESESISDKD